ncbi:hypothetical protein [Methanosarcina horonobensis]|uniref:hypothetical protein n=1 Tax=Methanosarcina horonobensis TaxID=418008 RepID=UPI000AC1C3F6|nr:hypothetical protein [Methanosarcina horonobensis]
MRSIWKNEGLDENRILLTSNEVSEEEAENFATGLTPAPVDLTHLKTVENLAGEGSYPVSYDLRALGA